MFRTNYNCHDEDLVYEPEGREFDFEPTATEQTGWLPVSKQVARLVRAGEQLDAWKREQFDFAVGEEDNGRVDPTRSVGFDFVDATEIQEDIIERATRQALANRAEAERVEAGAADESTGSSGDSEPDGEA